MKKLRWPLLIVVLALIAIGLLLLGQQPVVSTNPVAQVTLEPTTGGVYVEGLVGAFGRLNPLLDAHSQADKDIDSLLYSGLIRFDDRGIPQADLADSWGVSQDGMIYNFSLRPNAVWHDGQPVTSDDVIFTIDQMKDDRSLAPADLKEFWKQIEVKRLDDKTLQFRLTEAFAPFLDYLTFGVVPQHLLGELSFDQMVDAPFNMKPIGSGPYRFDHLIVEEGKIAGVALIPFADYYAKKPFIETFEFRYYPDAPAALAAYQSEKILGIHEVTLDILPDVLKEANLNLYTGRLPRISLVVFNLNDPNVAFFQDSKVRRALLMGLNRQWMVDHILNGQAILADGPILPGTWAYFDGIERVAYDANQATALLREAGFTVSAQDGKARAKDDGTELAFELLYPDDPTHMALAQEIQKDWSDLGVRVTLKGVPYDALVKDHLEPRSHQAALIDLDLSRSPDPDPYPFWHQAQATGGQNYSTWDDRQASEFLEAARVTFDLNERARLYRNFQVRFAQELPALPLFNPVYTYAISAQVQGVRMGPLFDPADRFNTATSWFLLAKRAVQQPSTPAIIIPTESATATP